MSAAFDSFVALLKRSGLLEADKLQSAVTAFCAEGVDPDPQAFARQLIASGDLTDWQVDKLQKGRHKGFFLGKYKLLRMIGKGGMSSVYLAEHVHMKRLCAIKVLPWKTLNDSSFLQRFYREAQMVAQLDHPNIVRAYDIDHEKEGNIDIHFLVMEFVSGRNLFEVVTVEGPLEFRRAVEYLRQGTEGLAYAHRAGMVHRDIKPGNFIVADDGKVKLMDLGLARIATTEEFSLTVAHDEKVLGTADYLAPEQAVDSHTVDPRADLYSLGCTLYFMLTGEPPFNEGTLAQRLLAHQTKAPPAIESKRADTPASLAAILRKLMEKKPANRYQTAEEVVGVLKEWLKNPAGTKAQPAANNPPAAKAPPEKKQAPTPSPAKASATASIPLPPPRLDLPAPQVETGSLKSKSGSRPSLKSDSTGKSPPTTAASKPESKPSAKGALVLELPSELPLSGAHSQETTDLGESSTSVSSGGSAATKGRKSTPARISPLRKLLGLLACVVIAVVAWFLFNPKSEPEPISQPVVSQPAVVTRPPVSGTVVTVGPTGNFGTLGEALQFVRSSWTSGESQVIEEIRIAEGITLEEALNIDNSVFAISRPLRIIGEGAKPPLLKPAGVLPVLQLRQAEQFHLENLRLDGDGRAVTAELSGYLVGTRLQSLQFEGVTGTAISATGVRGLHDRHCVIENCRFQFTDPQARGIVLQSDALSDSEEVNLRHCRFLGPGHSAIEVTGVMNGLICFGNLFHKLDTAVKISGSDVSQTELEFANNTFHQCRQGVQFSAGITPYHERITFYQNLFVQQQEGEVLGGAAAVDLAKLSIGMQPIRNNWTERAGGGTAELDVFATDGRRSVPQMTFVSEDPAHAEFLKPLLQELKSAVVTPVGPAPFIGAISP